MMVWNVFQTVITILELRMGVCLMENFAKARFVGSKQKCAVWIGSVAASILLAANRLMSYYSWTIFVAVLGILSLATVWMFSKDRGIAIFIAANYLFMASMLDLIAMCIVDIVNPELEVFLTLDYVDNRYRVFVMLFSKSLLFVLSWVVWKNTKSQHELFIKGKSQILIVSCWCAVEYLCELFVVCMLNFRTHVTQNVVMWLILFLLVAIFMLIICGLYILYSEGKRHLEQRTMHLELLHRNYQDMLASYKERDIMYHDFKNHLLVLDDLIERGEFEQCRAYMAKVKQPFMRTMLTRRTGDRLVDLILNCKMREAKENGIEVRHDIDGYIDFKMPLADDEICALLGNLWDNATEACQKEAVNQRWIEFGLKVRKQIFVMTLSNPCQTLSLTKTGKLLTTKKNKKMHGIGLQHVKEIVESKYGRFEYWVQDGVFHAEVILFMNEKMEEKTNVSE